MQFLVVSACIFDKTNKLKKVNFKKQINPLATMLFVPAGMFGEVS